MHPGNGLYSRFETPRTAHKIHAHHDHLKEDLCYLMEALALRSLAHR